MIFGAQNSKTIFSSLRNWGLFGGWSVERGNALSCGGLDIRLFWQEPGIRWAEVVCRGNLLRRVWIRTPPLKTMINVPDGAWLRPSLPERGVMFLLTHLVTHCHIKYSTPPALVQLVQLDGACSLVRCLLGGCICLVGGVVGGRGDICWDCLTKPNLLPGEMMIIPVLLSWSPFQTTFWQP